MPSSLLWSMLVISPYLLKVLSSQDRGIVGDRPVTLITVAASNFVLFGSSCPRLAVALEEFTECSIIISRNEIFMHNML